MRILGGIVCFSSHSPANQRPRTTCGPVDGEQRAVTGVGGRNQTGSPYAKIIPHYLLDRKRPDAGRLRRKG
jgi:hypothetical protein